MMTGSKLSRMGKSSRTIGGAKSRNCASAARVMLRSGELFAAAITGDKPRRPGTMTSAKSGIASVAGLLLKEINTFPSRFISYRDAMSTCTNDPNECPTPYTGRSSNPSTVSRNARLHLSYLCHASSVTRKWSNPIITGVAITNTSPRSTSCSRKYPYVNCGDAPTNAPPVKCTSFVASVPFRGRSTYASSTFSHPRSLDDPLMRDASASARSNDANASRVDDADADADVEEDARARLVPTPLDRRSPLDVVVVVVPRHTAATTTDDDDDWCGV
mmetsp:Transcript_2824/g.10245  ORF Transcript_2824/g.10245 Transcript_2824/m.10245 type:complete len:274 (-) Transcript_2824:1391-2212(-)